MNNRVVLRTVGLVLVIMVASACQNAPNEIIPSTETPRPAAPTPLATETVSSEPTTETTLAATAPTTVSGAPSGVVIIYPSADTYTDSEQPDANFGAADELYASAGRPAGDATTEPPAATPGPESTDEPSTARQQRTLLRFDVEGIPEGAAITNVTLRLFIQSPTYNDRFVYATNSEWEESVVTWNNSPAPTDVVATFTNDVSLHVWDQVRLENIIHGNGAYSFYIIMKRANDIAYRSREFTDAAPQLIIEWAHEQRVTNIPSTTVAGDPPVLVGAGDIADCESERDEQTAALIEQTAGLVFTLGDNAYTDGTVEEYLNCYEVSWGKFRDRTMPAVGDQDYNTPGAAGYFHYFGAAAGDRGYYSYDVGTWHVVVLNSNCEEAGGCDENSAQGEWLKNDLLAHATTCLMAYWHEPRFSLKGEDNLAQTEFFWQILYQYSAELVLNADERYYARFAKQNPGGLADPIGIRQFIVGTGGRNRSEFEAELPNVEIKDNTSYGVLRLTLNPTGYDWAFIPVDVPLMEFTDAGTEACH
jgi:acid phosphatase type 7